MMIQKTCRLCGKTQMVNISKESYDLWKSGVYLQDAAPDLSADDREILISGICGKCFDEAFSQDDEEEEIEDGTEDKESGS